MFIEVNQFIKEAKYEELETYFKQTFTQFALTHRETYNKIVISITCLKFLNFIRKNNFEAAYEVLHSVSGEIWERNFLQNSSNNKQIDDDGQVNNELNVDMYNQNNEISSFSLFNISSLLCFENPFESEYSFMLNEKQSELIAEQINSCILELVGLNKESILEIIIKQTELTRICIENIKNSSGEKIKIKS